MAHPRRNMRVSCRSCTSAKALINLASHPHKTHARRTPSWLGYERVRVEGEAGEMSESAEHAGEGVECVGWLTGHAHLSWLLRVQHEQQCDLALRMPWRASRDLNLSTHPHRRFNSGRVGPISAARGEVSRSRHSNARHRQRYPKGFQGSPGLQKPLYFANTLKVSDRTPRACELCIAPRPCGGAVRRAGRYKTGP